jgi:hypothetical protein
MPLLKNQLMKIVYALFIAISFSASSVNAQSLFNKVFQDDVTSENLQILDAALTTDGGSILVGSIKVSGVDRSLAIKLDADGDTLWVKRDNGAVRTYFSSVAVDDMGAIVIAGFYNIGFPSITKIDNSGNVFWSKELDISSSSGETMNTSPTSFLEYERAQIDVNGTDIFLATSSSQNFINDVIRTHLAKVNTGGTLLWSKEARWASASGDEPFGEREEGGVSSMKVLSNGNIVVTGGYEDNNGSQFSLITLYDSNGDFITNQTFIGSTASWIKYYAVHEMSNGNIVAAGRGLNIAGTNSEGMLLVTFDINLTLLRTDHFNNDGQVKDLIDAPGGGLFVLCEELDLAYDDSDRNGVIKLDASYQPEWTQLYGSSYSDYAWSIEQYANGDLNIVGVSAGFKSGGDYKAYSLRANSEGSVPGCSVEGTTFTQESLTLPLNSRSVSSGNSGSLSPIVTNFISIELESSDVEIDYSSTIVSPSCIGEQGMVDLTINDDADPYSFDWSNGSNSQDLTDFSGNYSVLIRDKFGCIQADTFDLIDPSELTATYTSAGVTCFGLGNGSIDLSPSGGSGSYTYEWTTLASTEDLANISGGFYQVTITDLSGCQKVVGIAVSEPQQLNAVILSSEMASCQGICDGQLNGLVTGGSTPYNVSWNDPLNQTNETAVNLCAGQYLLTVEDNNGCLTYANGDVYEPQAIELELSSLSSECGLNNGSAWATTSGGTMPYSYMWSNAETNDTIVGLDLSTYTATIIDANGCSYVDSIEIEASVNIQEICVISVDSLNRNEVNWSKPMVGNIAGYNIYRNIAGAYVQVGYSAYDAPSVYVDNTFGVDPNITSYRYKMSAIDTCGNESALSNYHETIHVTANTGVNGEVNLIWDDYEGFSFGYYYILRDSTGAEAGWEVIDSVAFTNFTYTDLDVPADGARYAIDVATPSVCFTTKANDYNSSRSNRAGGIAINVGISENFIENGKIYPNPTREEVFIEGNLLAEVNAKVEIHDYTGKIVLVDVLNTQIGTFKKRLNVSSLESGFYLIEISSEKGKVQYRLVIQ